MRKVLEAIAAREKKDVRALLRNLLQSDRKSRLLFLYGHEAVTDADVESGLQPYAGSYEIESQRISMGNPRDILDALEAATLTGRTLGVLTLAREEVRPVEENDLLHVRRAEVA